MISSQGISTKTANGVFFSQSIGQQSVIGGFKCGYYISQGFQQRHWKELMNNNSLMIISTMIYPNPFNSIINFKFSKPILKPIEISIFDVSGRLVYNSTNSITNNLLVLDLQNLAQGTYFVNLKSLNYFHYSQIIKQ
jgi:hypothetical protein